MLSCSTNAEITAGHQWNQLLVQGSAGANSPFLHEHDHIHVPVNENQIEASIKSLIELPLDKEIGEQNNHLLLSCPSVPFGIPIEIPVPCEENENGEIQQLIAQTQNDQGTLDGTPNYDSDYDDQEEIQPDYYLEEQNAHSQNNIGFQLRVNFFDRYIVTTPIQIYRNDKILACDTQRGWTRLKNQKISSISCLMIICLKQLLMKLTNMQEIELHTLQMAETLLSKWMTLLTAGIIDCTNGKMSMPQIYNYSWHMS